MSRPIWIEYGGKAWMSAIRKDVWLDRRIYPIIDFVGDNYGHGFIVDTGSLEVIVDYWDWMCQPTRREWFGGSR